MCYRSYWRWRRHCHNRGLTRVRRIEVNLYQTRILHHLLFRLQTDIHLHWHRNILIHYINCSTSSRQWILWQTASNLVTVVPVIFAGTSISIRFLCFTCTMEHLGLHMSYFRSVAVLQVLDLTHRQQHAKENVCFTLTNLDVRLWIFWQLFCQFVELLFVLIKNMHCSYLLLSDIKIYVLFLLWQDLWVLLSYRIQIMDTC